MLIGDPRLDAYIGAVGKHLARRWVRLNDRELVGLRWTDRRSHAGASALGIASEARKAAIRGVCRPLAGRRVTSSASKQRASGPRKSALRLGIGRASVYRV